MTSIKKIPRNDVEKFVDIVANAYPGMRIMTPDDREKMKKLLLRFSKLPGIDYYGLYRREKLLGGMALYDFKMNMFSNIVNVGGIGLVAVDLLHKKEKVCKEMLHYFLEFYHAKGVHMTALYPFRPDFYRKMGFGYGAKINQYSVKPADLPRGKSKLNVRFLQKRDTRKLKSCYHRFMAKRHGMMTDRESKWQFMFDKPEVKVMGYIQGGKILGYIVFSFKKVADNNWLKNNVMIHEFIYENRNAFMELMTFLHTQIDQVNRVIFGSHDDSLHHIFHDPRNGSDNIITPLAHEINTQGVGIMYRVINTKGLLKELHSHSFNDVDCKINLKILDNFFPKNEGVTNIYFKKGRPNLVKTAQNAILIELGVSDFSSLIMGVVDFKSLYTYGLVKISSEKQIETVNTLFLTKQKPMSTTQF